MNTYNECIAWNKEVIKALKIAEQYKMNSDRIKRLLSFNPVTVGKGRILINPDRRFLLWYESSVLINAIDGYINPVLLSP